MSNWRDESKQLKEQLLATQTNEETFRLEMEDITKTLGLDEDTIFDDVKAYVRSLKYNWNKLRELILEEGFDKMIKRTEIVVDNVGKKTIGELNDYVKKLEQSLDESEKLINTILNFSFFKEECPLNFSFEDNSKEDKAQNIFYSDEYCENNCNDIYKDCWLKYFKELQKAKGDVNNENNNV